MQGACQRDDGDPEHQEDRQVPGEERRLVRGQEVDGFGRCRIALGVVAQARYQQHDAEDEGRRGDKGPDRAGSRRAEPIARRFMGGGGSVVVVMVAFQVGWLG